MLDILGFDLDAGQRESLGEIHRLCKQRMAIKLPESISAPKGEAYEKIHGLDARIEKLSPLLEFNRKESRNEVDEVTGKLAAVDFDIPVAALMHSRIVWQYYFMEHPISMN